MITRTSQRGVLLPLYPAMETNCGVYCLSFPIRNECYVGQSHVLKHRVNMHIRDLQFGRHPKQEMQDAFDVQGFEGLELSFLQFFPDETPMNDPVLLDAEAEWTSKMRAKHAVMTRWRPNVYVLGRYGGQRAGRQADWDDVQKVREQIGHWSRRLSELTRATVSHD